jgi:hypothetical protein
MAALLRRVMQQTRARILTNRALLLHLLTAGILAQAAVSICGAKSAAGGSRQAEMDDFGFRTSSVVT